MSSNTAIVAEKPSVARDIARVVGASSRGEGYLHGGGYVVTWAVGHLVHLAEPHEMRPEWKSWRRDALPMLPREWPLVVYDKTSDQFEVVRKILSSPKIDTVVCATDAGREGELIFRYIYEKTGCNKPVRRLWISSLTPDAIRQGLNTMKSGADFDPLADAARGRSRADWLVGMNLSRAYTIALGREEKFSVGRVQTPTLAMLVDRELEVRAFVPEDYIEVVATFSPDEGKSQYDGIWFRDDGKAAPRESTRLPADGVESGEIVARARSGKAAIVSVEGETKRMAPPLLYDLTELQRHANRLYGFSAQKTLEVAQALYERHKLLSYPRTDSRHLSTDVSRTLPNVVKAISAPYQQHLAPGTGTRPLNRRYVDDTKVTDHHAIIPTTTQPNSAGLNEDERRIYDLVCRRLLQAWHEDHIYRVTTVITAIENPGVVDKYVSSGTAIEQQGWKVLDIVPAKKKRGAKDAEAGADDDSKTLPAGLTPGQPQQVLDVEAIRKKTRPPKRFTEGTLLTAMESAGKTLDDKELSDAMKETGLGTPATRAAIIEVLLTRGYAERQGKMLAATDKGIRLIEVVHPEVKSPIMTGQWEAALQRIHRGQGELSPFLTGIEEYVTAVVGKVFSGPVAPAARTAPRAETSNGTAAAPALAPLPPRVDVSGQPIEAILKNRFGFDAFRPGQEEVCRAVVDGHDALVVMPTGAGKSLCYQLPGLARGGTTIVISPLIALMEDQVGKLRGFGFHAERIHSGLTRAASRQVCIDYLNGNLDFLFIAPERFRVPGFPEMLAKRKPSLVCIDEAHCISQWGHDFRPDYRRIGPYLESFRPAPVLALTATATPRVQQDIAGQLQLRGPRFIQGFRRTNLAIEVVEAAPSRRPELAREILNEEGRLPAIVYTPSRKEAESVASLLQQDFSAAAYHAGLDAQRRADVQARFLSGKLDVIVATIAFGMGIDKPDIRTVIHTAAPGSIESYYQEIGRAGRDGQLSHVILMQSYADRRTHDFFFERDYPEPDVLAKLYAKLPDTPMPKDDLRTLARLSDAFDAALEKLWIHGGALVDFEENVARGEATWRPSYEDQRNDKLARLEDMLRYADCHQCRMQALVTHFGDTRGGPQRCGLCDFCAPDKCVAQSYREATAKERKAGEKVLEQLSKTGGTLAAGRLHTDIGGETTIDRRDFERMLGGLASAGLVRLEDAVFEKDGRTIPYRKVHLTMDGRAQLKSEDALAFQIAEVLEGGKGRRATRKAKKATKAKARKKAAPTEEPAPRKSAAATADPKVLEALKAWRLAEAKKNKIPAFRVMTDATLNGLATAIPRSLNQLLAVPGMGLRNAEKYGAAIFRVLGKSVPGY